MRKIFISLLLSCNLAAIAVAAPEFGTAHEVGAAGLQLPTSLGGLARVMACETCASVNLRITEDTLLEIGSETVPLDVMRRELAAQPDALVLVVISTTGSEVTRIWLPRGLAQ